MTGAERHALPGGRWLFEHGPIHCVIGVDGDSAAVARSLEAAWTRFQTVLAELVAELPLLRADLTAPVGATVLPQGVVARRMVQACRPYARQGLFITAMAAVAGSVAQELIGFFVAPGIRRAYVNNGGDIALHLGREQTFDVGLVVDPSHAAKLDGRFCISAQSGVRGIATSGWRGRSLSLGIADSVTVLAATAAQADAAATLIANAVNLEDDARIVRVPANQVRDDSDLGERLVTAAVPVLTRAQVAQALCAGAVFADMQIAAGRINAAALYLQGQMRRCATSGPVGPILRGAGWRAPSLPAFTGV